MNQVPNNENQPASADEGVARLLRLAGHRPSIPEWDAALVRRAAKEEWRKKVRSRRRRTLYLRAGGLLAAAVLAFAVGLGLWPSEPSRVATIEAIVGSVEILPAPGGEAGKTVFAGTRVATASAGSPARAVLRLAGGASLRLDVETRLELVSSTVLALEEGAVYVDSGPGAEALEVRTPLGIARDVGTQFEVRYESAEGSESLRIRVREGAVELDRGGQPERATAGSEIVVHPDGTVERAPAPGFGEGWEWIRDLAPRMEIEGRPLRELLEWFAREGGWRLSFADAASEELAREVMHGSPVKATDEDVFPLVRSNGLAPRFEDGELVIEKP